MGIHELQKNWVNGTQIVYIGKAKSLNERLKTYMDFGQGKKVNCMNPVVYCMKMRCSRENV